MLVEMQVTGLTIDPVNSAPIVVLREIGGARVLPIWVGVIEASAIAFELEQVRMSRPMTHDLMKSAIEGLGGTVAQVAIVSLKETTYYAVISLLRDGERLDLDARPSDAVAMALRTKAPLFCEESVLQEAAARPAPTASKPNEGEEPDEPPGPQPLLPGDAAGSLQNLLENLDAKAFGKYKM